MDSSGHGKDDRDRAPASAGKSFLGNEFNAKRVGRTIARLRAGRTVRALIRGTGAILAAETWSRYENGHVKRPALTTLEAIAKALGVDLAVLLEPQEGHEPPETAPYPTPPAGAEVSLVAEPGALSENLARVGSEISRLSTAIERLREGLTGKAASAIAPEGGSADDARRED